MSIYEVKGEKDIVAKYNSRLNDIMLVNAIFNIIQLNCGRQFSFMLFWSFFYQPFIQLAPFLYNPFINDKFLDWSILKAFSDHKIYVT